MTTPSRKPSSRRSSTARSFRGGSARARRPGRLFASPGEPDGRQPVVYILKRIGGYEVMARPKPEKKGDRAQLLTTRSLQTLSKEGLGAILPLADHWSTRGDASWRRAPWRQAIRPPLHWGCSNGGTADRDVPGVLSDDLARGYHRLRPRAPGPSRLSSASCSERRGADSSPYLLSGPPSR